MKKTKRRKHKLAVRVAPTHEAVGSIPTRRVAPKQRPSFGLRVPKDVVVKNWSTPTFGTP